MVTPIGKNAGGTTAGSDVSTGMNPELSTATGTAHVTSVVAFSGSAVVSMLAGHWIKGGVWSGQKINTDMLQAL